MKKIYLLFTVLFSGTSGLAQQHPASVITGYYRGASRELKDIPELENLKPGTSERNLEGRDKINKRVKFNANNPNAVSTDAAIQKNVPSHNTNAPLALGITFQGNGAADNTALGFGAVIPPDPTMSAGPNHIVQMINLAHSVYNKSGTRLTGPLRFSSIATGAAASDDGDPIVLYDHLADRWLLMQFSNVLTGNDRLIFCLSKTPNPSGAYDVFSFNMPPGIMPDYPHVGIWNNAYTITTHEFNSPAGSAYLGQGFYAIDRKKMLQGPGTVNMIRFVSNTEGGYLPASLEGYRTPNNTSDPVFLSWDADEAGAPTDRLTYRTATLNFITPALSTLNAINVLNTAAFDGRQNDIEASGGANLDAIADRMMSRVIYRRFDNYESLVYNYTVNVSGVNPTTAGTYQASVRWGELRRATPASAWSIFQEGTIAPGPISGATGDNRWMGSAGIDRKGNIAVAYSKSSSTTFPSLMYSERRTCDAPGTMFSENLFFAGGGSQTDASGRWGDYSAIAIDPANEDSLWFTGEYYAATSSRTFSTRIGSFSITPCPPSPAVHFKYNGTAAREVDGTIPTANACLKYKDYPLVIDIDQAPSQPVNLTINTAGTATQGLDYVLIGATGLTLNASTLSVQFTVRVFNDAVLEGDETLDLTYTMNVNGGNAVTAGYNQIHSVSIADNEIDPASLVVTNSYGAPVIMLNENFDTVTTNLGAWTEVIKKDALTTTNINHWVVSTNGGAGFLNKSMHISDSATTNKRYNYINIAPTNSEDTIMAVSPIINITGRGQVAVTFKYKCNGENNFDYGLLMYSVNGGTTWTTLPTRYQLVTTATTVTVNLPAAVENIPNLRIALAFRVDYSLQNQPPLGLDSVAVTARPFTSTPPIQSALNPVTAPTNYLGPNHTIHFIDSTTGQIMATVINNSAHDFGCTKLEVDRAGTGGVNFNSTNPIYQLASKTFRVTPAINNVAASYTLRLYYTEAEIAGWEAATGQNRSQLNIVKVAGNNSIGNVTPANYSAFTYFSQAGTLTAAYPNGFYIEAAHSGFSGFGIGLSPFSVLPARIIDFSGSNLSSINKLTWKVDNQVNVMQYELERAFDGINYEKVSIVPAQNYFGSILTYSYDDAGFKTGTNYYRVKVVDRDNSFSYSRIVLINIGKKQAGIGLYPNPVQNTLQVSYPGIAANVQVKIYTGMGQLMYDKNHSSLNLISINTSALPKGSYVIKVEDEREVYRSKFVKE